MKKEITTSAMAMQVLDDLLQKKGLSKDEVKEKTGIDTDTLSNPDTRIPLDQYLKLWETAIDVTGDPALGLHLKDYYSPNQMHFVTSIVLRSSNGLEALENMTKYFRLICEADKLEVRETRDDVLVVYTNTSSANQNRWTPELYLSLITSKFQSFAKGNCAVEEIWMQHSDPGYADEYLKVFNTPVQFNQPEYQIRWKKSLLTHPMRTHDPYHQAILKKYADESLQHITESSSFRDTIRSTIIQNLSNGNADVKNVSDFHHMDRRTMHRKLKKEGTTFTELLEEARKELATVYLKQGIPLTQITYLLGFSAPSNFQAAFKRWFSVSPGEYRQSSVKPSKSAM